MAAERQIASRAERSVSSTLLQRLREDDPEAWDRFVYLFSPVVYRWCRRSNLQPTDAADITQIVLGQTHRSLDRFRRSTENATFRGWLWTITKNKIRDHFREVAKQPAPRGGSTAHRAIQLAADLGALDPDQQTNFDTSTSVIHRALELVKCEFETTTWDAFWRTAVEKQRAVDVADDMGMTAAAVYKAKSRVLQRLRCELSGLLD